MHKGKPTFQLLWINLGWSSFLHCNERSIPPFIHWNTNCVIRKKVRKIITLKWEATNLLVTHEKSFRRPPSDLTCSLGHSHFPTSITDSRLSKGCGFSFFGTRFSVFVFLKFWKSLLVTALQCNALQTQARRGRKVAKAVNASQLICNKAVSESYFNQGTFLGQLFDEAGFVPRGSPHDPFHIF